MSSILLGLSAVFSVINVIPRLARSGSYGFHKNLERRKGEKNGRWSTRFVGGGTKERRKKIFLIAARMIIIIIAERTRKKTTILSKESKRRSNSIRRIDEATILRIFLLSFAGRFESVRRNFRKFYARPIISRFAVTFAT